MPITLLSLIAAPMQECKMLLAILKQAQKINSQVAGPDKKTVFSLDVGLYQPVEKLLMARTDLNHLILCPGEVMAQRQTNGAFIENGG